MRTLALLLCLALPVSAELDSGGATTDAFICGSATGIDAGNPVSVSIWFYPTTLTNGLVIIGKTRPSAGAGWRVTLSGTGGNIQFYWDRATTDLQFITNTTPLATVNKWYYIAVTADTSVTPAVKFYVGDSATRATLQTTGTQTNGSGAIGADSAYNFIVGNNDNSPRNGAVPGALSVFGFWINTVRTQGEMQSWQYKPRYTDATMKIFTWPGYYGTGTHIDWTGNGNNCTVTGMTLSAQHAPLPALFSLLRENPGRLVGLARLQYPFPFLPDSIREMTPWLN